MVSLCIIKMSGTYCDHRTLRNLYIPY